MNDINRQFTSLSLALARKEFSKKYPKDSTKGMWTYKFGATYEVQIPKNDTFPKGFYWHGRAYNASEAKSKALQSLLDSTSEAE